MREPLRGKIEKMHASPYRCAKDTDVLFDWFYAKDVCSAVEFYKKYRISFNNTSLFKYTETVLLLQKEQPTIYEQMHKEFQTQNIIDLNNIFWGKYNDWLFDYCFGDVVDD